MSQSERFGLIERVLRMRRSASFAELQERLGVSRATLFRDLRDLRDRMGAPIVRDSESGTYRLDTQVNRYELPGAWFSASEIHALLSMQQLLCHFDHGGLLAEHIEPLRTRLGNMLTSAHGKNDEIARRIRILSAAARGYEPAFFQAIAAAVIERRRMSISYQARSNGERSEREISPQRLTHYRDNWYLDAWCHWRDELRSFAVDAISNVSRLPEPAVDIPDDQLDATLGAGYGIFAGAETRWATLRFTAERARWVAGEHWHPKQEGVVLDDGRYQLRLPYSNDPELIMDILKYGPDCQVLAPAELREKVVGLLKAALGGYGDE